MDESSLRAGWRPVAGKPRTFCLLLGCLLIGSDAMGPRQATAQPFPPPPGSFAAVVDRETREITLMSDPQAPLEMAGYSIRSAVGSLDSNAWRPVANFGDANSGGLFDPVRNWVRLTASGVRTDLSEAVLGITTLAAGASHSFGADVWIPYWEEDLSLEYLDGNGTLQVGAVFFEGNGEQPYAFGDINFDGDFNEQDWLQFEQGLGGEFPHLSVAEAYHWGDLNGDLETDYDDFALFQTTYDGTYGEGAFNDMVRNLPEPTRWGPGMIVVLAVLAMRGRKGCPVTSRAMIVFSVGCLVMAGMVPSTSAQVLLFEDFEGVPLFDSSLASDDDNETDWSNLPPSGWTTDDRQTPSEPTRPEYQGWTFLDQQFWINQQGNQAGRSDLLPSLQPNNTIAVVDPDAHDDFINNDPAQFSSVLKSPVLDIAAIQPASIRVSFDSSWVPEDRQEVRFRVIMDGVPTTLFTWDSEPNDNFKPAATNESIEVLVNNPAGASELYFEWDMVEAGNDWWWAIDNILVESTGAPQFLELVVHPSNGEASLRNRTGGTATFNYYAIESESGALVPDDFPTGWHSLDDQNLDALGPGIGQSWSEGQLSDAYELVEAFWLGSSTLATESGVDLGRPFAAGSAQRDLRFFYAGDGGDLIEGAVVYLTPGDFDNDGVYGCADIDLLTGQVAAHNYLETLDLNGDGQLNQEDVQAWLVEAGVASSTNGAPYQLGDANLDGAVDTADFQIWNANRFRVASSWCHGDWNADGAIDVSDFHLWNRHKFSGGSGSPLVIPEPFGCSHWLLGSVVVMAAVRRGLDRHLK